MRTIVIIDTLWIGHVPTYHKLLIERFLAAGHRVISLCPKKSEIESWANGHFGQRLRPRLVVDDIFSQKFSTPPTVGDWRQAIGRVLNMEHYLRAIAWWQRCAAAVTTLQGRLSWPVDLVFLPGVEMNIITTALTGAQLDRIFPYKWCGLYVTPKYLRKNFFKFWHKRFFRKDRFFQAQNCIATAVLDEGVVARLGEIIGQDKVIEMPDVTNSEIGAPEHQLFNHVKDLAKTRKMVGLFGEISKRKGIATLIKAAHLAKELGRDWHFIFVGSLSSTNNSEEELRFLNNLILKAPDNCFFSMSRIENEAAFNDIFNSCDVIFASYEKFFHSSNILTKAAVFHKPALVSKGYCMHERVERFGIGVAIPEKYPEACIAGIDALLKSENLEGQPLALGYEAYAARHSIARLDLFLAKVLARLDQALYSTVPHPRKIHFVTNSD